MHSHQLRRLPNERARHLKQRDIGKKDLIPFSLPPLPTPPSPPTPSPQQSTTARSSTSTSQSSTQPNTQPATSSEPNTKTSSTTDGSKSSTSSDNSTSKSSSTSDTHSSSSSSSVSSSPSPSPGTTSSSSSSSSSSPNSSTSSHQSSLTSSSSSSSSASLYFTSSTSGTPSATIGVSPSTSPSTDITTSKGLSGSAIGGIVAGCAVVLIALFIFLIRKRCLRRREKQRVLWDGATMPKMGESAELLEKPVVSPDTSTFVPANRYDPPMRSPYLAQAPLPPPKMPQIQNYNAPLPPPPPQSYNNPTNVDAYSIHPPVLSPGRSSAALSMARAAAGISVDTSTSAVVKCTFVPSLPDELSITTGERVRLISAFDDGWALCMNGRGDRGMIPLECLERGFAGPMSTRVLQPPQDYNAGGWRNNKRASSLQQNLARY